MTAGRASRRNLAVIAAKARSTRFPGKNQALLAGKPLVVRAIEVAQCSGLFETVMVSTDDQSIAGLAREAGADVPFLRDAKLAADTVEVPAVVRNAVEWYQHEQDRHFDWVCILQPTCPLRTANDLTDSHTLISQDSPADAVVSVSRYRHYPEWALRIVDGRLAPCDPKSITTSRQHLPESFHPDGLIYWWRVSKLLSSETMYDGVVIPYHTPPESALDIDYPEDLEYAEWRLAKGPQIGP